MTFPKNKSDKQGYIFWTELTENCLSFPDILFGRAPSSINLVGTESRPHLPLYN